MKIVTRLVMAVMVLGVSQWALAADSDKGGPKWSYVEAGYMDFNPDAPGTVSEDGWYAGGSAKIAMFHVFAEYDDIGNYTTWNAGFGWHGLLGEPADLYFQAQWNDVKVDTSNNPSISDDGYEISGGVRWKILKWLEVKGQANWSDYSNSDEWSGEVGVLFSILNDRLGFGVDYEYADSNSDPLAVVPDGSNQTLRGYVRWSFGS
jgi:hypothetical protein